MLLHMRTLTRGSDEGSWTRCKSERVIREGIKNNMVKRIRVHGGCLGAVRRRRAWQAAKSLGEEQTSVDPGIPEWGNPCAKNGAYHEVNP